MSLEYGSLARYVGIALAGLAITALIACSHGESNVAQGNREGILHFGNFSEPQTIDPHVMSGLPEFNVASALYEGLVTLSLANSDFKLPLVAETGRDNASSTGSH